MLKNNKTRSNKFLFIIVGLIIFSSFQFFRSDGLPSDITILNPTKDCYIINDYNEYGYIHNNYNGDDLKIGYSGYGYIFNSFISFDLALISYVNTATLRLYFTGYSGVRQTLDYNISCITLTWDETTATWSNSLNNYNSTPETSFTFTKAGTPGWFEIDLTDTAKRWVAGTVNNFGIRIHGDIAGGNNCDFDSRESTNPPELVIDDTVVTEGNYLFIIPIVSTIIMITYLRKRKMD